MSTEASPRSFRRLLYGSVAVLSLLALGLIALNLGQGPRLTAAQMNVQTSVERAGQRLLLESNEVLAPVTASQVSVSPSVGVTATSNQTSIEVKFTDILRYNTTYTVTATGVRSASQQASSTFSYSFTTPDAQVYTLESSSSPNGADQIERSSLTGEGTTTAYTSPHIRSFTALGPSLVVNTIGDDGNDLLDIVPPNGAAPIPVQLAGPGVVSSLKSSAKSNLFGYTFRPAPSPYYPTDDDQLYIYDTTLGQAFSIPVSGPDHELLKVAAWEFVPATTSLVVLDTSGALYLADALGLLDGSSAAVDIGTAGALAGFIPGTKTLVTSSGKSTSALDFTAVGPPAVTPISLAGSPAVHAADVASPRVLDPDGAVLVVSADGASVEKVDVSGPSTVFTAPEGGTVIRSCLSPNGRYAVAVTADQPRKADNTVTSTYFSLAERTSELVVKGAQPDWCSGN